MRRILFDTDVVLDFLFDRQPYAQDTLQLLLLCERKELVGYVTPVIVSNCYYILRQKADHEFVKNQLKQFLSIVKILPMDRQIVQLAMHSKFKDFEDALQYYAARKSAKIDGIVTRNLKDFKKASLPIFSPSEMLQRVKMEH